MGGDERDERDERMAQHIRMDRKDSTKQGGTARQQGGLDSRSDSTCMMIDRCGRERERERRQQAGKHNGGRGCSSAHSDHNDSSGGGGRNTERPAAKQARQADGVSTLTLPSPSPGARTRATRTTSSCAAGGRLPSTPSTGSARGTRASGSRTARCSPG